MYECEFNCGFEDASIDKVEAHEAICPHRPKSDVATTCVVADAKAICDDKENSRSSKDISIGCNQGEEAGVQADVVNP